MTSKQTKLGLYRTFRQFIQHHEVHVLNRRTFLSPDAIVIIFTDRLPNFNGCTVVAWESISNFISHFTGHVITYPCWDDS